MHKTVTLHAEIEQRTSLTRVLVQFFKKNFELSDFIRCVNFRNKNHLIFTSSMQKCIKKTNFLQCDTCLCDAVFRPILQANAIRGRQNYDISIHFTTFSMVNGISFVRVFFSCVVVPSKVNKADLLSKSFVDFRTEMTQLESVFKCWGFGRIVLIGLTDQLPRTNTPKPLQNMIGMEDWLVGG